MSFPGGKPGTGYVRFILRFVRWYLVLCWAALLALLVVNALFPSLRVYGRIREALVKGRFNATP
jgi:hypothetical protein